MQFSIYGTDQIDQSQQGKISPHRSTRTQRFYYLHFSICSISSPLNYTELHISTLKSANLFTFNLSTEYYLPSFRHTFVSDSLNFSVQQLNGHVQYWRYPNRSEGIPSSPPPPPLPSSPHRYINYGADNPLPPSMTLMWGGGGDCNMVSSVSFASILSAPLSIAVSDTHCAADNSPALVMTSMWWMYRYMTSSVSLLWNFPSSPIYSHVRHCLWRRQCTPLSLHSTVHNVTSPVLYYACSWSCQ